MNEYQAPLRDMLFVINELMDIHNLPQVKQGELDIDLLESILEEAEKFSSGVLSPINRSGDQEGCVLNDDGTVSTPKGFAAAYQQFVESGWNSLPFDSEYGGQGLPTVLAYPVQEMMHSANTSFCLCSLLGQAGVDAISSHGSEEQKKLYLEKMITGEWTGTMQLTEPQAGTDLSSLKTKAERHQDGTYRLTGQKIYITYGDHDFSDNIIHMVLARVPDAPEGVKGISLFIVPKFLLDQSGNIMKDQRNDIQVAGLEHKLGINASPTCVMQLGENGGAVGYLVGEENEGLKYMFTMMNAARLGVGLQGISLAQRAYQDAVSYAKNRVQSVKVGSKTPDKVNIIEHEDVKRMLLSMKSKIEAARALAYEAAFYIDLAKQGDQSAKDRVDLLTPIVKSWCTDMAVDVSSTTIQVYGGMGFIEETGVAQYYRDSRILPIYEGTNGIQANDLVFRKVLSNKGSLVDGWLSETRDVLSKLSFENSDLNMNERLLKSLECLNDSKQWLIDNATTNIDSVAASANGFLNGFAIIAGGALLARSASIADKKIQENNNDVFYQSKLLTAEYYMLNILPLSQSYLSAINDNCGETVSRYNVNMF
jgi:alkylation response protein AidB-like acyl-CoA dehydrogenase